MPTYIEREELIKGRVSNDPVVIAAMSAHPADVAPVRMGKWAHIGGDEWCCTACGNVIHTEGSWVRPLQKFCEECGAKMEDKP